MIQWCWAGEHGALEMRRPEREAATTEPAQADPGAAERVFANVALVVGGDDNVGAALVDMLRDPGTPAGPWRVYAFFVKRGWDAKGASSSSTTSDGYVAKVMQADLALAGAPRVELTNVTNITHVFYAAWYQRPGLIDADANRAMLRHVLSIVVPNCPGLVHVGLLSGRDQLVDPYDDPVMRTPSTRTCNSEDFLRLEYPDLEDVLRVELPGLVAHGARVTWSVHRLATVFGFSIGGASRNVVASLCVYAAICRKEGATLRWPGSAMAWEGFNDASDADLVAEHTLWSALEFGGKNEVLNCTNGDVFQWKLLWPVLAKHFEVEWSGYEEEEGRFKLEEAMAGKEALWAEIIREKGLEKTELADITAWSLVDAVINADAEQVDNMNKSKERGFFGFRDTVKSFDTWIGKMKASRIVP